MNENDPWLCMGFWFAQTEDSAIAQEDIDRLAASASDDEQERFDEQENKPSVEELIERIDTLSPEQVAELLNYLQHGR